jgi:hypothetical protein
MAAPDSPRLERIFRLGVLMAAVLCLSMGAVYLLVFQDPVRFLMDTVPGWLVLLAAGGLCSYAVWQSRLAGISGFWTLWVQGLGTAWFGALLTGIYAYVLIEWADPAFVEAHRNSLVQPILSSGAPPEVQAESLARLHAAWPLLFGPAHAALLLIPVVGFVGSLVSLVMVALVRGGKRQENPPKTQNTW